MRLPSLPDLNALAIYATVVESNSFSEAARRLGMPVSTVSRRVSDLERELGVELLERSTRRLHLTPVGAEVFRHAQSGLVLGEAVQDIVNDHLAVISGTLRISTPPNLPGMLIAPMIAELQRLYPRVRVQLFVTERFVDLIAEGIDIAFIVGPLQDANLVSQPILTYCHRVLATPAYLKEHGTPKEPEDLRNHSLLTFSFWHQENTWNFIRIDGTDRRSITFRPYISMNDYGGIIPRLLEGAGIAELPPLLRPDLVERGELIEVMPDWRWPNFDLKVVHSNSRYVPKLVTIFVDLAVQLAPMLFPSLPTSMYWDDVNVSA